MEIKYFAGLADPSEFALTRNTAREDNPAPHLVSVSVRHIRVKSRGRFGRYAPMVAVKKALNGDGIRNVYEPAESRLHEGSRLARGYDDVTFADGIGRLCLPRPSGTGRMLC